MKIFKLIRETFKNYFFWNNEYLIRNYIKEHYRAEEISIKTGDFVWVSLIFNFDYIIRNYFFLKALAKSGKQYRIKWIVPNWNWHRRKGAFSNFIADLKHNSLSDIKWLWVARAFGSSQHISQRHYFKDKEKLNFEFDRVKKELKTKQDVVNFKLENVVIGDLIYDTYLRYKPSYTVDCDDKYFDYCLFNALSIFYKLKEDLSIEKPKFYLCNYASYIEHGIAVRVCIDQDVPVYSLSCHDLIGTPNHDHPFHTMDYKKYKEFLNQYKPTGQQLAAALGQLELRLSGGVDKQTEAYMKRSAYVGEAYSFRPKDKTRILIMAHDFYDSPHIHGEQVFPDFWEWICYLCQKATELNYDVFIKVHPNSNQENDNVIEAVLNKFSKAIKLPKTISNKCIVDQGEMDVVFTVHGTVAHEFAFNGIPCVSCGANPHGQFSFTKTIFGVSELDNILIHIKNEKLVVDQSEIADFLFSHNRLLLSKVNQITIGFNLNTEQLLERLEKENKFVDAYLDYFKHGYDGVKMHIEYQI